MAFDDHLVFQQYLRDCGDAQETLMRGFLANVQIHAAKKIHAADIFPQLRPARSPELLYEKIIRILTARGDVSRETLYGKTT